MNQVVDLANEKEKIQAAYALNLCTVSVSQIIDYNDINILEQEYDAILNNLNLQNMPDDEALLMILKQLLDTITFFRIQEGDKKMMDKEYQHQLKNAIWNAIPSMNIAVSGGDIISMAVSASISIVTSVGTGYMNYRRAKAELERGREQNEWKLQRAAIEQFNGLRRELFDTAWRLAKNYGFEDQYRLTERQISQYNAILMDTDEIRKYERLTTIKDKFEAYPPFWYYYGNCANYIAHDESLLLSDESREYYRNLARKNFNTYWEKNQYALLREDQIAATCALEYADLLDPVKDHALICDYLKKALTFSNYANDVVELCVMAYLKLNEMDEAAELLRILVNEGYNSVVNAQILSSIYVNKLLAKEDEKLRAAYELLASRVNPLYLFRLPAKGEAVNAGDLQEEFNAKQEELLTRKFNAVVDAYVDNYSIRLGKLLPDPEDKHYGRDFYFSKEGAEDRIRDMQNTFHSTKKKDRYLDELAASNFVGEYFSELNRFYGGFAELNGIRSHQKLQDIIAEEISSRAERINTIQEMIESGDRSFGIEEFKSLQELTLPDFFTKFVEEAENQLQTTVLGMMGMSRYAAAESALQSFCMKYGIEEPEVLIEDGNEAISDSANEVVYFDMELLGEIGQEMRKERERFDVILSVINNQSEDLKEKLGKNGFHTNGSDGFVAYASENKLAGHGRNLSKTIAIFDDKSLHNKDIMLTTSGLTPIIKGKLRETLTYEELFVRMKKILPQPEVLKPEVPEPEKETPKFLHGQVIKPLPRQVKAAVIPKNNIVNGTKEMVNREFTLNEKDYELLMPIINNIILELAERNLLKLEEKKFMI